MTDRTLTIAVRNLAGANYAKNPYRKPERQRAVWDALVALRPDLMLVQEATGVGEPFVPPAGWRAHANPSLARGSGSVVVVADGLTVELGWRPPHSYLDACAGYLDFALLRAFDMEIAVASVHAPTRHLPELWTAAGRSGPPPTSEARPWPSDYMLDALLEVLKGREVILAGDWNEARNYPKDGDLDAAAWFARAEAAGLIEVVSDAFGGPVRTNFTARTHRSYQNDHVFVSAGVAPMIRSVAVFNEPTDRRLSDHAGMLVTLAGP